MLKKYCNQQKKIANFTFLLLSSDQWNFSGKQKWQYFAHLTKILSPKIQEFPVVSLSKLF